MFLVWLNSWWMAIVLCGLAVIFVSAVTMKLDNKLIRAAKFFNNDVERNFIFGSKIFHGFLQITPMINSFLALVVVLFAFVIYNILQI